MGSAESRMPVTDLESLCKDDFVHRDRPAPVELNFSELKIKVQKKSVKWEQLGSDHDKKGPTSLVAMDTQTPRIDSTGSLRVSISKDNEVETSVNISKGYLKNLTGVNKRIRIRFPDELQSELGETFELDISQANSERKQSYSIATESTKEFMGHQAEAKIKTIDKEYEGVLRCKLSMEGVVVGHYPGMQSPRENNIGQIVTKFKDNGGQSDLTVKSKRDTSRSKVVWDLEARCKFRWMNQQHIQWTVGHGQKY